MLNVAINIIINCMFEDFAEPVAFVEIEYSFWWMVMAAAATSLYARVGRVKRTEEGKEKNVEN